MWLTKTSKIRSSILKWTVTTWSSMFLSNTISRSTLDTQFLKSIWLWLWMNKMEGRWSIVWCWGLKKSILESILVINTRLKSQPRSNLMKKFICPLSTLSPGRAWSSLKSRMDWHSSIWGSALVLSFSFISTRLLKSKKNTTNMAKLFGCLI